MKDLDNLAVTIVLGVVAVTAMVVLPAQLGSQVALAVASGLVGYLAKQIKQAVLPNPQ